MKKLFVIAAMMLVCAGAFAQRGIQNYVSLGVTGVTKVGTTCSDDLVTDIAKRTVFSVDDKPHGIFGVDMTYDNNGIPYVETVATCLDPNGGMINVIWFRPEEFADNGQALYFQILMSLRILTE